MLYLASSNFFNDRKKLSNDGMSPFAKTEFLIISALFNPPMFSTAL